MGPLCFQDKLYYYITGDDIAQQFFYLDADTGVITLKRLLMDDTSLQYNVSKLADRFILSLYYVKL